MICLDTNYLIRSLVVDSREAQEIKEWLSSEIPLAASSIVWYEFCYGPVGDREVDVVREVLTSGILPFDAYQATYSAQLYNAIGRIRRLRVDTMIAAAAISSKAELATSNVEDFETFCAHGLQLRRYGD
jgi:predicted nucleic acid-binding protein